MRKLLLVLGTATVGGVIGASVNKYLTNKKAEELRSYKKTVIDTIHQECVAELIGYIEDEKDKTKIINELVEMLTDLTNATSREEVRNVIESLNFFIDELTDLVYVDIDEHTEDDDCEEENDEDDEEDELSFMEILNSVPSVMKKNAEILRSVEKGSDENGTSEQQFIFTNDMEFEKVADALMNDSFKTGIVSPIEYLYKMDYQLDMVQQELMARLDELTSQSEVMLSEEKQESAMKMIKLIADISYCDSSLRNNCFWRNFDLMMDWIYDSEVQPTVIGSNMKRICYEAHRYGSVVYSYVRLHNDNNGTLSSLWDALSLKVSLGIKRIEVAIADDSYANGIVISAAKAGKGDDKISSVKDLPKEIIDDGVENLPEEFMDEEASTDDNSVDALPEEIVDEDEISNPEDARTLEDIFINPLVDKFGKKFKDRITTMVYMLADDKDPDRKAEYEASLKVLIESDENYSGQELKQVISDYQSEF